MKVTTRKLKQLDVLEWSALGKITIATGRAASAEKLLFSRVKTTKAIDAFVVAYAAREKAEQAALAAMTAARHIGNGCAGAMLESINNRQRDRDVLEFQTLPRDSPLFVLVDSVIEKLKAYCFAFTAFSIAGDDETLKLDDAVIDAKRVYRTAVAQLIDTANDNVGKDAIRHLLISHIQRLIPYAAEKDDFMPIIFYCRAIESISLSFDD